MAVYTVLDKQAIAEILKPYELGSVESFKVLSGGSENTNYLVDATQKKVVLTVCEQKSDEAARELASLLVYLNAHGFATSELIQTKAGELITIYQQKPVMLKAFIEGVVLKELPEALLTSLGRDLARLHQIPPPAYIPNEISYGIQNFEKVAVYSAGSPFHHWITEMETYISSFINAGLPKALIHSDIFYNNIIVSHDRQQARIMDFEEATHYYRIFDIGMFIIGVCSEGLEISLDQASYVLRGYQEVSEFTRAEKEALQAFTVYAAAATAFWRHQNFNYVKPNPDMFNHYQAMQKLADSVRKIPEEEFMKIMG